MKIKKGRYRLVLVFPSTRIAIKFHYIRLFVAISDLKELVARFGYYRGTHIFATSPLDQEAILGFRHYLFGGIVFNWREFLFFCKTRNSFLQPTYFSFFGLVNVQLAGDPLAMDDIDLHYQMHELTEGQCLEDGHHFQHSINFCLNKGQFRILDYGDKKTQKVIEKFGLKIQNSFDVRYTWEERKKASVAQKT